MIPNPTPTFLQDLAALLVRHGWKVQPPRARNGYPTGKAATDSAMMIQQAKHQELLREARARKERRP